MFVKACFWSISSFPEGQHAVDGGSSEIDWATSEPEAGRAVYLHLST